MVYHIWDVVWALDELGRHQVDTFYSPLWEQATQNKSFFAKIYELVIFIAGNPISFGSFTA